MRNVAIATGVLLLAQLVNFAVRQPHRQVACTDKSGKRIVFTLNRNLLSFDGDCQSDDGLAGAACRRGLELVGAEGGLCELQHAL